MKKLKMEPWQDEEASRWLANLESWPRMIKLIQTTLKQDPRKYPHQIRAAAATVIMFGKQGLWPEKSGLMSLSDVASLARRQLAQVKHLISVQARIDSDLVKDRAFRSLLNSLDQELRILESRTEQSETLSLPQQPPATWGKFWFDPPQPDEPKS